MRRLCESATRTRRLRRRIPTNGGRCVRCGAASSTGLRRALARRDFDVCARSHAQAIASSHACSNAVDQGQRPIERALRSLTSACSSLCGGAREGRFGYAGAVPMRFAAAAFSLSHVFRPDTQGQGVCVGGRVCRRVRGRVRPLRRLACRLARGAPVAGPDDEVVLLQRLLVHRRAAVPGPGRQQGPRGAGIDRQCRLGGGDGRPGRRLRAGATADPRHGVQRLRPPDRAHAPEAARRGARQRRLRRAARLHHLRPATRHARSSCSVRSSAPATTPGASRSTSAACAASNCCGSPSRGSA